MCLLKNHFARIKQQLKHIHETCLKHHKALSCNLVLRKVPLYEWLFECISQGDLGEIYAFDGDYLYGRIHKVIEGWRGDCNDYSVMAGGGVHLIDLMLLLTDQKPIEVTSCVNKITTRNTKFRYPDFHSSIFQFESGLIGRITANYGCVHHHQHVLRIFGTKGTFIYDDQGARIHWDRDETVEAELLDFSAKPTHKGLLIPDFVAAIQSNQAIAQREFDLMSVVMAADESIHSKQPITIEYLS